MDDVPLMQVHKTMEDLFDPFASQVSREGAILSKIRCDRATRYVFEEDIDIIFVLRIV